MASKEPLTWCAVALTEKDRNGSTSLWYDERRLYFLQWFHGGSGSACSLTGHWGRCSQRRTIWGIIRLRSSFLCFHSWEWWWFAVDFVESRWAGGRYLWLVSIFCWIHHKDLSDDFLHSIFFQSGFSFWNIFSCIHLLIICSDIIHAGEKRFLTMLFVDLQ